MKRVALWFLPLLSLPIVAHAAMSLPEDARLLTGEEILAAFSGMADNASVQDADGTQAQNHWHADGRFRNEWRNDAESGVVLGRWRVKDDLRCVQIHSGIPELEGKEKCGPVYQHGSDYLSLNADGTVHGIHRPIPMPGEVSDPLSAALGEFIDALQAVEVDIRQSPSFGDEAEQVGGYRHILRALSKGIEAEVLQDADFPYFRILDFWLKEGGDNPDQRYAFSPVRGGETYRVWGTRGSAARVELQLYAGRPWDGSGKSVGFMAFEDLELAPDGSFEVWISAQKRPGNWLYSPPEATTLFSRHIYDEWTDDTTGTIHIDKVGYEGRRKPPESREALAQRIRDATTMFATSARTWPAMVNRRYVDSRPANTVSKPLDTYALGGVKGRWMSGAHFDLADDEALVLRMPATSAHYQAVQLADMWFASLEHANQVSSLTTKQSVQAPDGAYYYVVSQRDPGYANWLDSGELSRGVMMLRWDGVRGKLTSDQFPEATVVPLADIADAVPGFAPVSEEEREQVRRERRQHLQLRSYR